jgi:hypothetical protein
MKNTLSLLFTGAILAGITPLTAQAQTPAITSLGTGSARMDFQGTVGFKFSLSAAETLDSLGVLDLGQSATVEVGIYDYSTGDLLADADVVVPGTTLDTDSFDYSPLLTFSNNFTGTLAANTDYVIGADVSTEHFLDQSMVSSSSVVDVEQAQYGGTATSGFVEPNVPDLGGGAFLGPNFEYSTPGTVPILTPEPSTYALILTGLGTLLLVARLRRRTQT